MSEIQKAPRKSIFVQQLEKQAQKRNDASVTFFRRLNRPRNNTFNHVQLAKFLRIKYPLIAGIFVTVGFDYIKYFYANVPQGH